MGTLLCDAVIITVALVLAELAIRSLAPQYTRNLYDREFTGSNPIAINADGYRGALVPVEKQPGEQRILALGDSVTFGTGAAVEDIWPSRLAERANATVINAAMPGASVRQLTHAFEHRWAAYQPDVVSLAVTGNMVSLAWIGRDAEPSMPRDFEDGEPVSQSFKARTKRAVKQAAYQLGLPSFLSINSQRAMYRIGLLDHALDPEAPYGPLLAYGMRQSRLDPAIAHHAWELLEDDLAALKAAVHARDARLVVTYAPTRFATWDSLADNEKAVPRERLTIDAPARFADVAARLDVPAGDLVASLRRAREQSHGHESLYLLFDYNHFDPQGHEVVAQVMGDLIGTEGGQP